MKYGQIPVIIGTFEVQCTEMMYYQYMPIKLAGFSMGNYEPRLDCFEQLITRAALDFSETFGYDEYIKHYIYITAKSMYQAPNCPFNREGWHSDGFLTNDVNYIWSDKFPTIFNISPFNLTLDHTISMHEMAAQADPELDVIPVEKQLLRLNQYCIHKVAPITVPSMRTFVKLSFSKDRYDLIGNTHNFLIDYNWPMRPRKAERNTPQKEH